MASLTPPRTRTLELETSALSHAVALAGWIQWTEVACQCGDEDHKDCRSGRKELAGGYARLEQLPPQRD
jgi:hypothetical protein